MTTPTTRPSDITYHRDGLAVLPISDPLVYEIADDYEWRRAFPTTSKQGDRLIERVDELYRQACPYWLGSAVNIPTPAETIGRCLAEGRSAAEVLWWIRREIGVRVGIRRGIESGNVVTRLLDPVHEWWTRLGGQGFEVTLLRLARAHPEGRRLGYVVMHGDRVVFAGTEFDVAATHSIGSDESIGELLESLARPIEGYSEFQRWWMRQYGEAVAGMAEELRGEPV